MTEEEFIAELGKAKNNGWVIYRNARGEIEARRRGGATSYTLLAVVAQNTLEKRRHGRWSSERCAKELGFTTELANEIVCATRRGENYDAVLRSRLLDAAQVTADPQQSP